MNYLLKLEDLIIKLKENGAIAQADRISLLKQTASTSSELLMSITYELMVVINDDNRLKELIGDDVNELKEYCYSIGLDVRI